jgi:hypothetical protein
VVKLPSCFSLQHFIEHLLGVGHGRLEAAVGGGATRAGELLDRASLVSVGAQASALLEGRGRCASAVGDVVGLEHRRRRRMRAQPRGRGLR